MSMTGCGCDKYRVMGQRWGLWDEWMYHHHHHHHHNHLQSEFVIVILFLLVCLSRPSRRLPCGPVPRPPPIVPSVLSLSGGSLLPVPPPAIEASPIVVVCVLALCDPSTSTSSLPHSRSLPSHPPSTIILILISILLLLLSPSPHPSFTIIIIIIITTTTIVLVSLGLLHRPPSPPPPPPPPSSAVPRLALPLASAQLVLMPSHGLQLHRDNTSIIIIIPTAAIAPTSAHPAGPL